MIKYICAKHQSIYAHTHSACEHYSQIGYQWIEDRLPDDVCRTAPEDEECDDDPGLMDRWRDNAVLVALIGASPPPENVRRKRGEPKPEVDGPREKPLSLAGVWIDWPIHLPELKVWAGQASLTTITDGRLRALHQHTRQPGTRLLDWKIPYSGMSGLDARTASATLDIGFSPSEAGLDIATYVAAELLMIIGMQVAPVTRFGRREYGYLDPDGQWWRYRVVERERYHRMLTMSERPMTRSDSDVLA